MSTELDPDRLFPADQATRNTARSLYESVAGLPILSTHGHVDPRLLVEDRAFSDPAELFVRHDHYVTRLMHAAGIPLERLGIPGRDGDANPATPREVWRTLCEHWHLYAGTASGYWLRDILAGLFGIGPGPSGADADSTFDRIQAALDTPAFRPRALFERFGIEVMATTDDPMDDLAGHRALADDPSFTGRVIPTFRPDAYLDATSDGWLQRVARLTEGRGADDYGAYLGALADRRRYFIEHGAVSADHGVAQPLAIELESREASALFDRARAGTLTAGGARLFGGHMLLEMARMSVDDGLVMTVHPGVTRNHNTETFQRYGADMGNDIPTTTTYAEPLRPLLERYGNLPDFHLVLFTVDEAVFSREIAPLAGFYPSVYIGAPWWFLDAPDSVQRFRSAVTETAGFYRGSGFVDDTRAFLSIPARHDMSRRLDAAYLARLVAEGRLDLATAQRVAVDLADAIPRTAFKL